MIAILHDIVRAALVLVVLAVGAGDPPDPPRGGATPTVATSGCVLPPCVATSSGRAAAAA